MENTVCHALKKCFTYASVFLAMGFALQSYTHAQEASALIEKAVINSRLLIPDADREGMTRIAKNLIRALQKQGYLGKKVGCMDFVCYYDVKKPLFFKGQNIKFITYADINMGTGCCIDHGFHIYFARSNNTQEIEDLADQNNCFIDQEADMYGVNAWRNKPLSDKDYSVMYCTVDKYAFRKGD